MAPQAPVAVAGRVTQPMLESNVDVLARIAYRPFGIPIVLSGSEPTYGYTGEYRESTPNLVYLHSRWYDPTIGRFLSPDDRLGRLSMPQDQNRYAYVVNNPMAYTDPTGHGGCATTAFGWGYCLLDLAEAKGADVAGIRANYAATVAVIETAAFIVGTVVLAVATGGTSLAVQGFLAASFGSGFLTLGIYLATTPNPTLLGALGAFGFGFGVGGMIYGGLQGAVSLWRWLRGPRAVPAAGANAQEAATRVQEITDDVAREYDNGLLGRPPGNQPAAMGRGNVIHAEVARRTALEGLPVRYHGRGPDFSYIGGGGQRTWFEVTTPGQVGRHLSRFANQGYGNDIIYFILY